MLKSALSKIIDLNYKHKAGLFLISLSTLLLEFTLIRILSVSQWYHFAFMIISIALLGIGISGVVLSVSDRLRKIDTNYFFSITSLLFSFSIIIVFVLINKIPFEPFSILKDSTQFFYLPIYYILITLPFFISGLIICKLFSSFKNEINKLYFFDLVGAGVSCFVFIWVMPAFGGSGGIIFASLIAAASSFLFSINNKKYQMVFLISSFIIVVVNLLFITNPEGYLPIRVSESKVYANYMKDNPELKILTKWNSFSKVDLIKDDDPPADDYPVYTAIIDEGNSTTNIPFIPKVKDSLNPPFDASNLAMILKKDTASVFIIGSGGGGEIISALSHNAKSITAVEINDILNKLIKDDLANYWTTGIAENKKVKIITDDARSWLRGKRIKYDVIISAHTISASAMNSGAMSLIENYILTEEALTDYLYHLKPDGILYITRPEPQIPRLISSIKTAHAKMGALDLKNQFFVFRRPPGDFEKDVSYLSGVLYKKDGFSEYDIQILKTQANILSLETLYDHISKQDGIYKGLIETDDLTTIISKHPLNLSPATDDKPYFEHTTDFTKLTLNDFKEAFDQDERAMVTLVQKPIAETTLIILFLQIAVISFIMIFIPFRISSKKNKSLQNVNKLPYLIYFSMLGLGFIMIEICFIQKFTLFLGQPVYTMLTVISTMLIFSGIGSMVSNKILKLFKEKIYLIFTVIIFFTLLLGFTNQFIFQFFSRAELLWRIVISVLLIAPLGLFMGIPFPYGFKKISQNVDFLAAYSWGVNGFFSVIGSILVVIVSMSYGFRIVFLLTASIYAIASLTVNKLNTNLESTN